MDYGQWRDSTLPTPPVPTIPTPPVPTVQPGAAQAATRPAKPEKRSAKGCIGFVIFVVVMVIIIDLLLRSCGGKTVDFGDSYTWPKNGPTCQVLSDKVYGSTMVYVDCSNTSGKHIDVRFGRSAASRYPEVGDDTYKEVLLFPGDTYITLTPSNMDSVTWENK